MLVCSAVSSCAKVMPAAAWISSIPSVPSVAVPERITPIALWLCSSASERMKMSIGWCSPRISARGESWSMPSDITSDLPGGIT
jgi:hypothetical protein